MGLSYQLNIFIEKHLLFDSIQELLSDDSYTAKLKIKFLGEVMLNEQTFLEKLQYLDETKLTDLQISICRLEASSRILNRRYHLSLARFKASKYWVFHLTNNSCDSRFANYMDIERTDLQKIISHLNCTYAFASSDIYFSDLSNQFSLEEIKKKYFDLIILEKKQIDMQSYTSLKNSFYFSDILNKHLWIESSFGFGNNYPYILFYEGDNDSVHLAGKFLKKSNLETSFLLGQNRVASILNQYVSKIDNENNLYVTGNRFTDLISEYEIKKLFEEHRNATELLVNEVSKTLKLD